MSTLSDILTPPLPPDIAPDRAPQGDQYDIKIDDLRNKIKLALDQISSGLSDTGVVAGDYPLTGQIPTFTVHADGRLYAAGSVPATFAATVPSTPPSGPSAAVVPPILTTSGAVAMTATKANGTVTLTSNATFDGTTYTATNTGQPAYVATFAQDGSFTMGRVNSAPSTFTASGFNDYVTIDKTGTIISPGSITRTFGGGVALDAGGTKITTLYLPVVFGKKFPSTPSSITANIVVGTNIATGAPVDAHINDTQSAIITAVTTSANATAACSGTAIISM